LTIPEVAWALGRYYMGLPTRAVTRPRTYGIDRVPKTGGVVYAMNHMHWIDVPLIGVVSPRNIDFVAKAEAVNLPGIGQFLRWHGTIAVRRGESDRDAVRRMRESARAGHAVGLFVEGTRNDSGRPGSAQPGAAMVAIQEDVPVAPVAIYGTQFWKVGDWSKCSVAFGEPLDVSHHPRNSKGYRAAAVDIQQELRRLWEFLVTTHEQGRPRNAVPPA